MTPVFETLNLALATAFFSSTLPSRLRQGHRWTGAGTVGSLWGLASLPLVPKGLWTQSACLILATLLAVAVCGRAESYFGTHDDQRIILDEWVGYWVAVAFLPREWPLLIGGLVLFRIFDMWKSPVGHWLSKFPGGWGIVLDDTLAGLYTNLTLRGIRYLVSS